MTAPQVGPALRDSQVMGRNAALVMVGISGAIGALSLTGVDVSGVVANLGDGFYRMAWGLTLVVAAVLVGGSVLVADDEDSAWVECAGLVAHALAAAAYGWAVVTQAAAPTDSLFVGGYIVAAVANCLGRVVLLARRIRWVRRQVRA